MKRTRQRNDTPPGEKRGPPFHGRAELLRRLDDTARHALASKHVLGPLVVKELSRIADLIVREGRDAPGTGLAALQALAGPAVDIQRDTGAPVAKHLTAAIRVYTKPPKPKLYVSPKQFIRQMQFRRQLRAMLSAMRRDKRPPPTKEAHWRAVPPDRANERAATARGRGAMEETSRGRGREPVPPASGNLREAVAEALYSADAVPA